MNKEELERLWELYKDYCCMAGRTRDCDTDSAPGFLGWLEYLEKDE